MSKNIIKYIRQHITQISVSIICAYAFYLRFMVLYRHTLWRDELFYLEPMQGTFVGFLKDIPRYEFCSYLSGDLFIFYPFFKIFSFNKWGLAIPPIIATVAGFYLLYLICKRYFKSVWAYLITFSIICFNATLINHSTEIRVYAFLPTVALATFYSLQRITDLNFNLSLKNRVGFIIFFVLVIWFHVYGVLIFISSLVFFIFSKFKENDFKITLKRSLIFVSIILGLAMPLWLYSVFGPHVDVSINRFDTFDFIPNPINNIIGFLKGVFCNLVGYKMLYFLMLGLVVPFVLYYKNRYKQLLFFFAIVVLPICSILTFDILRQYWFLQRQFIWVIPLFAFLLGWVWDSLYLLIRQKASKNAINS